MELGPLQQRQYMDPRHIKEVMLMIHKASDMPFGDAVDLSDKPDLEALLGTLGKMCASIEPDMDRINRFLLLNREYPGFLETAKAIVSSCRETNMIESMGLVEISLQRYFHTLLMEAGAYSEEVQAEIESVPLHSPFYNLMIIIRNMYRDRLARGNENEDGEELVA